MDSREKADAAVGSLLENTRNSYEVVLDHVVAQQERNVRFAQGVVGAFGREYRQRTDANLAVAQELFENAEKQYDALQAAFEESLYAWVALTYAPFSFYNRGIRGRQKG